MKSVLVTLAVLILLFGCNESKKENYTSQIINQDNSEPHPGKKLLETNCYVCHSPIADHDTRIGPPMIAIKKHYINNKTTKAQFIEDIQEWIKDPTEEKARMFGAVRRFGVMPKTPYPEETITQIADYLFDNDIEQPEWFEDHFKQEKGKQNRKGKGMGHDKPKNY
ncbi:MAG: hypothetical protein KJP09_09735 [Bacteroidia bacterium]|nr:hypothetical protein [Bacteroidia bacterium]NND11175.1 hypothetical protein [Flavobacteriaceae bacterium]NNK28094.1 hypothetical protein [Flavobacteriaceae bacterium]